MFQRTRNNVDSGRRHGHEPESSGARKAGKGRVRDVFDMRDEMYRFFEEFEPDLRQHPGPATLLRGVGIDLKEMLVEIEAWAVVPRKK